MQSFFESVTERPISSGSYNDRHPIINEDTEPSGVDLETLMDELSFLHFNYMLGLFWNRTAYVEVLEKQHEICGCNQCRVNYLSAAKASVQEWKLFSVSKK